MYFSMFFPEKMEENLFFLFLSFLGFIFLIVGFIFFLYPTMKKQKKGYNLSESKYSLYPSQWISLKHSAFLYYMFSISLFFTGNCLFFGGIIITRYMENYSSIGLVGFFYGGILLMIVFGPILFITHKEYNKSKGWEKKCYLLNDYINLSKESSRNSMFDSIKQLLIENDISFELNKSKKRFSTSYLNSLKCDLNFNLDVGYIPQSGILKNKPGILEIYVGPENNFNKAIIKNIKCAIDKYLIEYIMKID